MEHHALQEAKFQQPFYLIYIASTMTVYHNHHNHHHHRGSYNVAEGDNICVTVLVNYIVQ